MYSPRSIIRLSTVGVLVAAMAACAPRPEPEPIQPDPGPSQPSQPNQPGGPLQLAIGAQKLTQHFFYINPTNENTFHTEIMEVSRQYNKQLSGAFFGQLNVPVVSEEMGIPLVEGLLFGLVTD